MALPILVLFMAGTAAVAAVVAATPTVEYAPAPYAQTQSDVTL